MTDKRKHIFDQSGSPSPAIASHNENRNILEIVKVIARRAAEADHKGQLEKLRAIRQRNKKTHE
jgi:hypothetical protein